MADQPIGVTFMPSQDQAANGPRQAGIEGGGSDLAQAFKILSLHLPRVLGASAIAPRRLLGGSGGGSAGVSMPSGSNPYAQVFQALLQSLSGAGGFQPSGGDPSSLSSQFGPSMGGPYGITDPPFASGPPPQPNFDFGVHDPLPPQPPMGGGSPMPSAGTEWQPPDQKDTYQI